MKHRKYINESFGYHGANPKIDGVSDSYKYGRSIGYIYCDCEIGKDHEVEREADLPMTQDSKQKLIKEYKLKFNEVLNRMYNLEILPEIQSRINERIPESGGFRVFENEELESFLLSSLSTLERQVRKDYRNELSEKMKFKGDCEECGNNMSVLWPAYDPLKEDSMGLSLPQQTECECHCHRNCPGAFGGGVIGNAMVSCLCYPQACIHCQKKPKGKPELER